MHMLIAIQPNLFNIKGNGTIKYPNMALWFPVYGMLYTVKC